MAVDKYSFGGRLFAVNHEYSRLLRRFDNQVGIFPGQDRILTVIKDYPGMTLNELVERCAIGKPSLSVSINALIKSGYVLRQPENGINRRHYLTDSGAEKAELFHRLVDNLFGQLIEKLGDDGEAFDRGMEKFLALMSECMKDDANE